jgi:transglutaminase-like putative cysteine protease
MDWLNENMKYDHSQASLRASSEHAFTKKTGHCSDYHGLCAAFGRALGYPTRITYGINTFPKNSPSHCKLEAYLPPYGWVSFDVSETQKLIQDIKKAKDLSFRDKHDLAEAAVARLHSGFRDNTWYLQTKGTDYDLAPPAAKRVPVVRTLYVEADGVALPDPDPANPSKHEFAWMTAHQYTPDHPVEYPFKSWKSLQARPGPKE